MRFKKSALMFAVIAVGLAGSPAFARQEEHNQSCNPRTETCRHTTFEACSFGENCAPNWVVPKGPPDHWPDDMLLD